MSVEMLLEDLRRKSSQRVAAIRRQAESDAATLRAELEKEVAAAAELQASQLREEERIVAEPVIRAAEIEALRIEDDALRELGERLYAVATTELGLVRKNGYESLFETLVAELPEAAWAVVRVNPQDLQLARSRFPGAEILGDPKVIGGFVAESDQGCYRVISTLEGRMAKAWPLALPLLLRGIMEGFDA